MHRFKVALLLPVVLTGCSLSVLSQTGYTHGVHFPNSTAEPGFLRTYAETFSFRNGAPSSIKVVPDGSAVLFLRGDSGSPVLNLYSIDTQSGQESVLLTAEQILGGAQEKLSQEELARRERQRMSSRGIASYELSKDGNKILTSLSGRLYVIDRLSRQVTELGHDGDAAPVDAKFSPDSRYVSCVRNGELYVLEVAGGQQRRLTSGAGGSITNGLAEFVAQEEMGRHSGYWWSPDSTRIVYQQTDTAGLETMHIADAKNPAAAPATWPYPRAGEKNASVRLGTVSVEGGETTWIQWDQQRYPYLCTVRWQENAPLTILVQNRPQTEEALLSVDPDSGAVTSLLVETDSYWLNLDQSMPKWLADGSAFLWTTERRGAWQLELRGADGSLIESLTGPWFEYRDFAGIDDATRSVYVLGGKDALHSHLYRVPLNPADGTPDRLTEGAGTHGAIFGNDAAVYVHTQTTLTDGTVYRIRRPDGTVIADIKSNAQEPPFEVKVELTEVGLSPKMAAAIVRPRNFARGRRYPVIVHVYGGPHSQMVSVSRNRYLLDQWIADHGFIVVAIDGRGTPNKGRRWERAIKGNLIDLPLEDQANGLRLLAGRYPEMDITRVGIYGWSFGGYFSAMAVMRRPDVFHVGVAGAPVADWKDYDTHYTERYLGMPDENKKGYEASSVLTYAKDLKNPLMIIHGTADDNVYLVHSLKMADALLRAGCDFKYLPLPGFTHSVREPAVVEQMYSMIMNYFGSNLLPQR